MIGTPKALDFDTFKRATRDIRAGVLALKRMSPGKGPIEFRQDVHGLLDEILKANKLWTMPKPRTALGGGGT